MAAVPSASIEEVNEVLSNSLRGVGAVTDAWISALHATYDVWLVVEPVDMAAERELYALVNPLYERFPQTAFSLHILNPQMFDDLDPSSIVPARAHHVELRTPA